MTQEPGDPTVAQAPCQKPSSCLFPAHICTVLPGLSPTLQCGLHLSGCSQGDVVGSVRVLGQGVWLLHGHPNSPTHYWREPSVQKEEGEATWTRLDRPESHMTKTWPESLIPDVLGRSAVVTSVALNTEGLCKPLHDCDKKIRLNGTHFPKPQPTLEGYSESLAQVNGA